MKYFFYGGPAHGKFYAVENPLHPIKVPFYSGMLATWYVPDEIHLPRPSPSYVEYRPYPNASDEITFVAEGSLWAYRYEQLDVVREQIRKYRETIRNFERIERQIEQETRQYGN